MADLISQIKGTNNVTYDLQDKVSTFGGTNLLYNTRNLTSTNVKLQRSTLIDSQIIRLTPTTSVARAKIICDYLSYANYKNNYLTVSFKARLANVTSDYTSFNIMPLIIVQLPANVSVFSATGTQDGFGYFNFTNLTSEWQIFTYSCYLPTDLFGGAGQSAANDNNLITVQFNASGSSKPVEVCDIKLEKGSKFTQWTPAPQDLVTNIGNETIEFFQ